MEDKQPLLQGHKSKSMTYLCAQLAPPSLHLVFTRPGQPLGSISRNQVETFCSSSRRENIQVKLRDLLQALEDATTASASVRDLMRDTIICYNESASSSNFRLLDDVELVPVLRQALPIVIGFALELPDLHEGPLPCLCSGEVSTLGLSRKLCASLLANSFLCTYPPTNRVTHHGQMYPSCNFVELFDTQTAHQGTYSMKKEKMRCLLNYFIIRSRDKEDDHQFVVFLRKMIEERRNWEESTGSLCKMVVTAVGSIEDCDGHLKVDFANRIIGGGVLRNGCVQEEISFCCCPELIVSRIFTEPFGNDDAMEMNGAKNYSRVAGYSATFRFLGHVSFENRQPQKMVAIDATQFQRSNPATQLKKLSFDRELHKALVGYTSKQAFKLLGLASGNWGCGAFNGNPELKFILQWIAASESGWKQVRYHTFGNLQQKNEFDGIVDLVVRNGVTVGKLYKALLRLEDTSFSVFEHIRNSIISEEN